MQRFIGFCAVLALATLAYGQAWDETTNGGGDAGDLPGSAQITTGVGALTTITGLSDAASEDKDMYLIQILAGGGFSADLISARLDGSGPDDTKLYLLDAAGYGIAGDDDSSVTGGAFDAGLPLGDPLVASLPAGLYYLAVTDYNYIPTSIGGNIFPGGSLVGPTGPGGADPMTGWSADSHELSWRYTVALTGAEYAVVPEPASLGLLALAALAAVRRR